MIGRRNLLLGASTLALMTFAGVARAAEPETVAVEEVIVTAQKRSENIQDVPLSIMAVSEKALEARGVEDVTDLERLVPNLRLDTISQAAGLTLRIRGFGASSNAAIDPSVAPYVDGVFIPRPGALLTSFLDVESVEILRGPQGTLFGRNATVGALSVRTHGPDLSGFGGQFALQASSHGGREGVAIVNLPVSDRFGLRIAAIGSSTDGFVENRLDGQTYGENSTVAGRVSAKWLITDDVTWTLRAEYAQTTGDGVVANPVDISTATPAQLGAFTFRLGGNTPTLASPPTTTLNQLITNPNLTDRQTGLTSDLSWEFGDGYTLRLIGSSRDWSNQQSDGDVVFTPKDLLTRDAGFDSDSRSAELQLISPEGALLDGRLDFVAGLYYFDEDYLISENLNLGSQYCSFVVGAAAPPLVPACNAFPKQNAATNVFTQSATSKAAYLQATFAVTPTIDLILGARQTKDEKSGGFVQTLANPTAALLRAPESISLDFSDSQPSWRANLSWHATDNIMAFVTYSTGYKSGGLNSAGGSAALGARRLFNSETATDWELGVKSVLFDRRLLLNVTAYRTELDDFQERSFDGVSFIIRNAGSIRAQGVELEGQARPTSRISLDFGAAFLDSTFTANRAAPGLPACTGAVGSCPTTQDLTGRTPTFSPKWQANIGGQYTTGPFLGGFTATVRADANYSSSIYSTNDLNPQGIVDEFTIYGGRITLTSPDNSWTIAAYGQNLADEQYFRMKFPQVLDAVFGVRVPATGATLMRGFVGTPRTVGVRLTKSF